MSTIIRPSSVLPVPGSILHFTYPRLNEIGRWTRLTRRTILVQEIRDTSRNPIALWAVDDNPLRRRGRFLITGIDLDIGLERSFYWESMRAQLKDTWLRLATFEAVGDPMPLDWIGGLYAPTKCDRLFLSRVIRKFNAWVESEKDVLVNLGVFAARSIR